MLGFTIQTLTQPFATTVFRRHRQRVRELLDDLDVALPFPATRRELLGSYTTLVAGLGRQLRFHSQVLADFFTLGGLLLPRLSGLSKPGFTRRTTAAQFNHLLGWYGIDRPQVERRLRRPGLRTARGAEFVYELFSTCYEILTLLLLPGRKDERTCFVIMPFSEPFPTYYAEFYRPALRQAGYQPVRAWEGISDERYLFMLQVLMSFCGAALADVSSVGDTRLPNLNVIHEVGLAQVILRHVALIRAHRPVRLPSNFGGTLMGQYYPGGDGWPDEQARDLARQLPMYFSGRPPADFRWLRRRARRDGTMI
jgi:hypothetical protein